MPARTYLTVASGSGQDPTPAESAQLPRQTSFQEARIAALEETLAGVIHDLAELQAEVARLRISGPAAGTAGSAGRARPGGRVAPPSSASAGDGYCFYAGNQNMDGCTQASTCMIYMKGASAKPKYRHVCPVCRDFAVEQEGFAIDYVER